MIIVSLYQQQITVKFRCTAKIENIRVTNRQFSSTHALASFLVMTNAFKNI